MLGLGRVLDGWMRKEGKGFGVEEREREKEREVGLPESDKCAHYPLPSNSNVRSEAKVGRR